MKTIVTNNLLGVFTMSRAIRLGACLAVCLFAATSHATIIAKWTLDNSNATGLGAPPAGFTAWNMTVDSTTDWTNSRLDVNLTAGSMNHLLGGFPPGPRSAPQGLGDTSVFSPANPGESNTAGAYDETPTKLGASWFDTKTTDIGNGQLVARLVLSNDATGTLTGAAISGADVDDFGFVIAANARWRVAGGQIVAVPEPATIALAGMAAVGLFAVARRRKAA